MKKARGQKPGPGAALPARKPSAARTPESAAHDAVALQQLAGNQAVTSLLTSGGEPLAGSTRETMEARFAHDFSDVRVHQGPESEAASLAYGARAFTVGSHVWLGPRAEVTDSTLLGHELAHVVQQRGAPSPSAMPEINAHSGLEAQAQQAGAAAAGGGAAVVAPSGAAGVQREALSAEEVEKALDALRNICIPTEDFPCAPPEDAPPLVSAEIPPAQPRARASTPAAPNPAKQEQPSPPVQMADPEAGIEPTEYTGPLPESLNKTLDPNDLTGPQLQAEVEAIFQWLYLDQVRDDVNNEYLLEQYVLLSTALNERLEILNASEQSIEDIAELQRKYPMIVRLLDLVLPPTLEVSEQARNRAFALGFVGSFMWNTAPNDIDRAFADTDSVQFLLGIQAGIPLGMLYQLGDNIVGLLELALYTSPLYQSYEEIRSVIELGLAGYGEEKKKELRRDIEISIGVAKFAYLWQTDPGFSTEVAGELGSALGELTAEELREFAGKEPFEKGKLLGELEGRIGLEILLSLIPGQKVVAAARGSRLAAKYPKLANAILKIARNIPELAKYVDDIPVEKLDELADAGKVVDNAEDIADGRKVVDRVEGTAGESKHVDKPGPSTTQAAPEPAPPIEAQTAERLPAGAPPQRRRRIVRPSTQADVPGKAEQAPDEFAQQLREELKDVPPVDKGPYVTDDVVVQPNPKPGEPMRPLPSGKPRGTMLAREKSRRAAKKSNAEVIEGRTQPHQDLSADEQKEASRLTELVDKRAEQLRGREADRVSAGVGGHVTKSGTKEPGEGFTHVPPDKVRELGDEIGHTFAPAGAFDARRPDGTKVPRPVDDALFNETHAEKKAAVLDRHKQVYVNEWMCEDCERFFSKLARADGENKIITGPNWQRIFHTDGTVTTKWNGEIIGRTEVPERFTPQ